MYTKTIIPLKKDIYKPENIHITLLIEIIFKSDNIYKKHPYKPQTSL